MYKINFETPIHVHFMGIGGISMSGFAMLLHSLGFTVTGSDNNESEITDKLEAMGIRIAYGQKAENISSDIDLVVYTAAIHPDNPEFIAAKDAGIPMMDRAEMVGQVMKNYQNAIAVSGTHGKTTTTSMLSHILLNNKLDPTISVGGILPLIDGNMYIGKSQNFITEACEYTNSFLKFHPTLGIILNIEEDHMDFFKDINDIRHSFHSFAKLIPSDGLLVINKEIDNYTEITDGLACQVLTYSTKDSDADYYAKDITYDDAGCGSYHLIVKGEDKGEIHLQVVGAHNVSNSLAAICATSVFSLDFEAVKDGIFSFTGTNRRFQMKGKIGGVTIIDDYAHHPTEIRATLEAASRYTAKTRWCVFQPHTYTRTKAFLKDFASALSLADKVVLADIYAAREADPGDISSLDLKKELEKLGTETYYFPSFDEIENFLLQNCIDGDLLITMGAGNVDKIGESLLGL
ncbi:MAG: UDP-N-acetylmuramate--L-alanine ligase [Lachnospiraceae bacterium]|nr:UDP-N-acetylmuramate--L-alanine ligase [Lachnospiraceae bacterium]